MLHGLPPNPILPVCTFHMSQQEILDTCQERPVLLGQPVLGCASCIQGCLFTQWGCLCPWWIGRNRPGSGPEDGHPGGLAELCLLPDPGSGVARGQGQGRFGGLLKNLPAHASWEAGACCLQQTVHSRGLAGGAARQLSPQESLLCSALRKRWLFSQMDCHSEIPQTTWHKQRKFIFSQFWRLGSPRSRCQLIQFLVRALFLTCRWLPSCYVLTGQRKRGREWTGVSSSSHKDANPIGLRPHL